ncbi:MAG: extracellular solute-binding protein [Anaerolineales bacterium]|nr:extracellular solute-binding protein [Anaerolineales bacterium]
MKHHHPSRRTGIYLTAFWRIVLVLLLVLPLTACEGTPTSTLQASGTPAHTRTAAPQPARTRTPSGVSTAAVTTPPARLTTVPPILPQVSPADLRGLIVQFWHPWGGEAGRALNSIIADFNRNNAWGITAQVTTFEGLGALQDAVSTALYNADLPDLLAGYTSQAMHWDVGGSTLVDLQSYTIDPEWGLAKSEIQEFYPVFWDADMVTLPGEQVGYVKRLGIPLHRSAYVIGYNTTWAKELGYANPPSNPASLSAQACAAARAAASAEGAQQDSPGGWALTTQPQSFLGWVAAFGGQVARPDGNGYQFDTPESAQALEFLKNLQDNGCAWQVTEDGAALPDPQHRLLFYPASLADLTAYLQALEQAGVEDQWTVIPFPSPNAAPVIITSGPSLFISHSTPEEQLAAWALLKWVISPANQARWVQSGGYLPTRTTTIDYLGALAQADTPWAVALELLPLAQPEPVYASWEVTRWLLQDALQSFYLPTLTSEKIPSFLADLNTLAAEVHNQVR